MYSTWLLSLLARRYLFHLTLKCRYAGLRHSTVLCVHIQPLGYVYSYCFSRFVACLIVVVITIFVVRFILFIIFFCCCLGVIVVVCLFFFHSYRRHTETRILTHPIICDVGDIDPLTKNTLQILAKMSDWRSLIFVISTEFLSLWRTFHAKIYLVHFTIGFVQ